MGLTQFFSNSFKNTTYLSERLKTQAFSEKVHMKLLKCRL